MKEMEKVEIFLYKETIEEIRSIVHYENYKNQIHNQMDRPTTNTIEDFITGCINFYLSEIKKNVIIAGFDDLGKPYRLKNRFKDILDKKNMRQKDLADKTNIDPASISMIMKNKSQPSLDYFLRIWIALDCPSLDQVLYREE